MTEEHRLPSDSDEDDEDYVPEAVDSVSEAESEGEAESDPEAGNADVGNKNKCRSKHKRKTKRRRVEIKSADDDVRKEEDKKLTEEEEKKRADSLWADFMKDTGKDLKTSIDSIEFMLNFFYIKGTAAGASLQAPTKQMNDSKPEEKVKITKVFEFAGEEVKVEKEVSINSMEAMRSPRLEKVESLGQSTRGRGVKRGGISSILGQLGKRAKISTLEKSKLDWDNYKKQENLEEEISTHNKGKGGYLERQDFLQRADLRQFEIEKQMRTASRRSNR
ncbi:craniofacial development protein 1 isoform X1 [Ceratina calcarata]|uniref:Craniofacial development protein 1 n=1 Tax=Ceratina calcarata TaxID=156304 RepID=A0AAJ7S0G4_9HYME|nr:craniofacial development protein 1 isoform X1 [Ceratina calcarata]XP_026669086.1 craniofacial development protein 1 isoform X1 [Ceratina calcarata]XP_026669087.1 craniofacial development protein 1 isoform X1 [Ceratina calcarata]XP_026669088.1 craniofacial development protein 1 isoform X1 [Ceratina calcarata]